MIRLLRRVWNFLVARPPPPSMPTVRGNKPASSEFIGVRGRLYFYPRVRFRAWVDVGRYYRRRRP